MLWRFFLLRGSCHFHSGTGPSFYGFLGSHSFASLSCDYRGAGFPFCSYWFLTLEGSSLVFCGLLPGGLSCAPEIGCWIRGRCCTWVHAHSSEGILTAAGFWAWCPYLALRWRGSACSRHGGHCASVHVAFHVGFACLHPKVSSFCRGSLRLGASFSASVAAFGTLISLCSPRGFVLESSGSWLPLVLLLLPWAHYLGLGFARCRCFSRSSDYLHYLLTISRV